MTFSRPDSPRWFGLVALLLAAPWPAVASGLLADFRFDGSFTNLAGASTGLRSAGAKYVTDRFGQAGRALSTPDSGQVGSQEQDFWKNRRAWTWAGWVRVDRAHASEPGYIYSEGNRGVSGGLGVLDGRFLLSLWNQTAPGGWTTLKGPSVAPPGEWQHLAVTLATPAGTDLGTASIYLNGALAASGPMPFLKVTDWRTNHHEFGFGVNASYFVLPQPPYPFHGAVDDVVIYGRALPPEEVAQLAGTPAQLQAVPALELTFLTQAGRRYRLQSSADLVLWLDEDGVIEGTGTVLSRFASLRQGRHRYWRLLPLD